MYVSVIGAGHWGKNLVNNFHALNALGSVAEPAPGLRAALAGQYPDLPLHADHRAALDSDVTAVVIATPVASHFALAREALLAGKDVFVEKPLTLSSAEARELVRLADEHQRLLMVGHLLLYQPAIQWIKRYLDEGHLGRLRSLHQERLNLGKVRSVENALWSLGVHDVAVLLHLVGAPPSRIEATGHRVLQPEVEDDVYLHLGFSNGIQAHLHTSWLWPEKRRRLTVVGDAGMLVFDEADQTVTLHRKTVGADLAHQDGGQEVVFQGAGEPLRLECEHFMTRLKDRGTPLSDGRSAIAVVQVLEEATRRLKRP